MAVALHGAVRCSVSAPAAGTARNTCHLCLLQCVRCGRHAFAGNRVASVADVGVLLNAEAVAAVPSCLSYSPLLQTTRFIFTAFPGG